MVFLLSQIGHVFVGCSVLCLLSIKAVELGLYPFQKWLKGFL